MKPLVTICCHTFNHAKFITSALEGFVMQQTNFPYEILINDDASTDGTQEILKEYAEKYSNITLLLHNSNQWGEGMLNGTYFGFEPFIYNILPLAKGKYLAFCEGDDYWTDPLKLQKQVDYLESHPEHIMCYHSYSIISNRILISSFKDSDGKDYSNQELISVPDGIASSTKMFRNIYTKEIEPILQHFSGDYLFTSYLGIFGSCGYVPNIEPSVYRLHPEGVWTRLSKEVKKIRYVEMLENLYNLHLKYGTDESAEIRKSCMYNKDTFGIILPTYRRKDGKTPFLLRRALDSIFSQTYKDFKIYLIGDKYDNEKELSDLVSQYPQNSIYYENLSVAKERDIYPAKSVELWCSGGVNAHNYAISKAESDRLQYICFLDHDDQWTPDHLQLLHDTIKETGAHWLCTKANVNNGVIYLPKITTDEPIVKFIPFAEGLIKSSACFNIQTIPLRFRDAGAETGNLFPSDADLWRRMNTFIVTLGLKSYYINTLTCIYVSGGIKRPNAKVISWREAENKPIPKPRTKKPSWREKISMIQDRSNFKQIGVQL